MNIRLVCYYLGWTLLPFGLSMLLILPFVLWFQEWTLVPGVLESVGVALSLGGFLLALGWGVREQDVFRREAMAVVGLTWLGAAFLGSLPLYLSHTVPHLTDAFFESMSGLTTTGASILTDVESHPKPLLFWRSWLHFLGGLGIVLIFIVLMPVFPMGGKVLYRSESTGPEKEGMTPRIKDTAFRILVIYLVFNIVEMSCLRAAGMPIFEALNHAMATVATGGFSPRNASIGTYNSWVIEWIAILFMILSATNYALHLEAAKGNIKAYIKDTEFKTYILMIICGASVIGGILYVSKSPAVSDPGAFPLRDTFFSVTTIHTTTGLVTQNYDEWPAVCRMILFFLMCLGGMGNSSAGGIKVIRWVILFKVFYQKLQGAISPRAVRTLKVNGKPIESDVVEGVLIFILCYLAIFAISSVMLAMMMPQQHLTTSMSAVLSCMSNIGPGLGAVGPAANYASQSDPAKWLLCFNMILGRLEIFPIMLLFSPRFWRGR